MAEQYDAIEREVGICAYLSEEPGFAAVLKARFSDFLVHETNNNGEVAILDSLKIPNEKEDSISKKEEEAPSKKEEASSKKGEEAHSKKGEETPSKKEEEAPSKKAEESSQKEEDLRESKKRKHSGNEDGDEDIWIRAKKRLTSWVGEDPAKNVVKLIRAWEDGPKTAEWSGKFVELPKIEEKEKRKEIHQWIRGSFSKYACADTHEGQIRIWHKKFEKEMPSFGKFDKVGKPRTARAKKQIWPEGKPNFLQFVLYKENVDTGTATGNIVRNLRGRVRLGYAGMKDKRGITSQFCTLYQRRPEEIISFNKARRSGGGGSTYGNVCVIRVGNFKYVNRETNLGMLKGNRFDVVLRNVDVGREVEKPKEYIEKAAKAFQENGFINYFGMQRFGKDHDTHKVGIEILKRNFKGAVDMIMRTKPNEAQRTNFARKKWEKRFESLADEDRKTKEKVEKECAGKVLRDMGRFMACEVALLNCLKREPLNYRKAWTRIPKHIRSMFLHAVQSVVWNHAVSRRIERHGKKVCVGDLVQLGKKEQSENGESSTSGRKGKIVKVLTEEDLKAKTFSLTDVVIPLVGTKIDYPENETNQDIEDLLKGWGLEKSDLKKIDDKELSLGGDYRKIVCKPSDINYTISEYTNPLQPLIPTDLMKINKEELKFPEEKSEKKSLNALVVGFTLPPSSYATVALRELMKRPTSSEYQRQLQLEGECEGSLGKEKKDDKDGMKIDDKDDAKIDDKDDMKIDNE
mmetsp:Transcript_17753/g.20450  ORF Transcript_17753/g.20450 Transcript_17753/m.20450 type:complete len:744 (-) Transcript_17753:51-2282(-)